MNGRSDLSVISAVISVLSRMSLPDSCLGQLYSRAFLNPLYDEQYASLGYYNQRRASTVRRPTQRAFFPSLLPCSFFAVLCLLPLITDPLLLSFALTHL